MLPHKLLKTTTFKDVRSKIEYVFERLKIFVFLL